MMGANRGLTFEFAPFRPDLTGIPARRIVALLCLTALLALPAQAQDAGRTRKAPRAGDMIDLVGVPLKTLEFDTPAPPPARPAPPPVVRTEPRPVIAPPRDRAVRQIPLPTRDTAPPRDTAPLPAPAEPVRLMLPEPIRNYVAKPEFEARLATPMSARTAEPARAEPQPHAAPPVAPTLPVLPAMAHPAAAPAAPRLPPEPAEKPDIETVAQTFDAIPRAGKRPPVSTPAAVPMPVAAPEPAAATAPIKYFVRRQALDPLLRELGQISGTPVIVGPGLRATVQERWIEGTLDTILDQLAREHSLFWFTDGLSYYVDLIEEQKTRHFKVKGATPAEIARALDSAGLGKYRNRIQATGRDGMVRVTGSEAFNRAVEAALASTEIEGAGAVRIIRFGRSGT